jgi:hypothetical protein
MGIVKVGDLEGLKIGRYAYCHIVMKYSSTL